MPPSQKEINIYEALKELGTRVLQGEFGRGDNFNEGLYADVYSQLLIPVIFPEPLEDTVEYQQGVEACEEAIAAHEESQATSDEAIAALDEAFAVEKETGDYNPNILKRARDLARNILPAPEETENVEETADNSEEKTDDERWPIDIVPTEQIDTGPAEDSTETFSIDATEVGSLGEDVLGKAVDGEK